MRPKQGALLILSLAMTPSVFAEPAEKGRPLQVFILAGQSNMVGAARTRTIEYLGEDPATRPMLEEIRDSNGEFRLIEDTWISYYQSSEPDDPRGEGFGQLTAGYGARKDPTKIGDKIGPELTFGIYVQKKLRRPILIIKTAWGGKSLYQDFRPPSAGPYRLNESEIANLKKRGRDPVAEQDERNGRSGAFYRLMLGHVRHVLGDIRRVYPDYDDEQGYEIAGFVWFQGWNDLVNRGVYPKRAEPDGYDEYSRLLALFIRDVRKDLGTPKLPFVIGVMGTNGPIANLQPRYQGIHANFRKAMAAPAALPEFQGNVLAVETYPFWDMKIDGLLKKRAEHKQKKRAIETRLEKGELTEAEAKTELAKLEPAALSAKEQALIQRGSSDAAYHYLGSAKTMALIGKAFADGLVELRAKAAAR